MKGNIKKFIEFNDPSEWAFNSSVDEFLMSWRDVNWDIECMYEVHSAVCSSNSSSSNVEEEVDMKRECEKDFPPHKDPREGFFCLCQLLHSIHPFSSFCSSMWLTRSFACNSISNYFFDLSTRKFFFAFTLWSSNEIFINLFWRILIEIQWTFYSKN